MICLIFALSQKFKILNRYNERRTVGTEICSKIFHLGREWKNHRQLHM